MRARRSVGLGSTVCMGLEVFVALDEGDGGLGDFGGALGGRAAEGQIQHSGCGGLADALVLAGFHELDEDFEGLVGVDARLAGEADGVGSGGVLGGWH